MIWALGALLAGMVLLLVLGVAAFSPEEPSAERQGHVNPSFSTSRHRAPMVSDGWANSIGEGWVLHMNGDAELVPSRHRSGVRRG